MSETAKLGLWICPHGGGRWEFNTRKWGLPINSYSGWTRHTTTHISFGEEIDESERPLLAQYDYFILFSTTVRAARVVERLRDWFPNKKIVMMTDGYAGDFAECNVPNPAILPAIEKCDMILGNRPDAGNWVRTLVDVPYHWLGFPIEMNVADKVRQTYAVRPKNRINVYHAWKAASMMRIIQRKAMPTARFISFKNPANEFTNKRGWKEPDWAATFGVHLETQGDTEWGEYMKTMAQGRIALCVDLIGQLGRFSTEMAALAIPCIGTNTIGRHAQLHPDLTVPVGSDMLSETLRLVRRLNDDDGFYKACADGALARVREIYAVEPSLKRWAEFQEKLWA